MVASNVTITKGPYEDRLRKDFGFSMEQGSRHFRGDSDVDRTLRHIAKRLNELQINYAVAGGMALNGHGYERFTSDIDIIVTESGLKSIHEQLEGLGFLPPFKGSKNLRDVETGVKIEFILTGQFPGDGKQKPVSFPDPANVTIEIEGIKFINLPTLVELKLASGMTAGHRLKDLADVQELIKALRIPREFASQLNPYVRSKFDELWSPPELEQ